MSTQLADIHISNVNLGLLKFVKLANTNVAKKSLKVKKNVKVGSKAESVAKR